MLTKNKTYLVAVSGGSDSIFLLYWLLKEYPNNKYIVASVDYNFRPNSNYDYDLVQKMCSDMNIIFEGCIRDKNSYFKGNLENYARKLRYEFFNEVYKKYNCHALLIAHHKDDFLETALMQEYSKRKPLFYGIKKININFGMKIIRPLIDLFYKNEIVEFLNKNNISYAIDETNDDLTFTRNKIRFEIREWKTKEKDLKIQYFNELNNKLELTKQSINKEFMEWKNNNFSQNYFKNYKFKSELIFQFIHSHFINVKLNKNKIESIKQFILSNNRTKSFKLNETQWLHKKQGKLLVISNI